MTDIQQEIQIQKKRVEEVREALNWADPLFHDSAVLLVSAEESKLDALYVLAGEKAAPSGFILPWVKATAEVTV